MADNPEETEQLIPSLDDLIDQATLLLNEYDDPEIAASYLSQMLIAIISTSLAQEETLDDTLLEILDADADLEDSTTTQCRHRPYQQPCTQEHYGPMDCHDTTGNMIFSELGEIATHVAHLVADHKNPRTVRCAITNMIASVVRIIRRARTKNAPLSYAALCSAIKKTVYDATCNAHLS